MSARLIIDLYIALRKEKSIKMSTIAYTITKYASNQTKTEPQSKQKVLDYINVVQCFLDG